MGMKHSNGTKQRRLNSISGLRINGPRNLIRVRSLHLLLDLESNEGLLGRNACSLGRRVWKTPIRKTATAKSKDLKERSSRRSFNVWKQRGIKKREVMPHRLSCFSWHWWASFQFTTFMLHSTSWCVWPRKFTYNFQGRPFRLTDVEASFIHSTLADRNGVYIRYLGRFSYRAISSLYTIEFCFLDLLVFTFPKNQSCILTQVIRISAFLVGS